MTYKTLGGGLDLSLSMESKSNSLPLMMSAGGAFRRDLQGILGEHLRASRGKRRQKTANIAIWREKSRFVEVRPFVAISEYTGVISCEAVICQKVTLRFACFSPC